MKKGNLWMTKHDVTTKEKMHVSMKPKQGCCGKKFFYQSLECKTQQFRIQYNVSLRKPHKLYTIRKEDQAEGI